MMLTLSQLTAELIDRGITVLAGVVCTLIGFGVIPLRSGTPEQESRLANAKRFCRWGGPVLIVIGLVLVAEVFLRHR